MNTHCHIYVNTNYSLKRAAQASGGKHFRIPCEGDQRIKQQQLARKKYRAKTHKNFYHLIFSFNVHILLAIILLRGGLRSTEPLVRFFRSFPPRVCAVLFQDKIFSIYIEKKFYFWNYIARYVNTGYKSIL